MLTTVVLLQIIVQIVMHFPQNSLNIKFFLSIYMQHNKYI